MLDNEPSGSFGSLCAFALLLHHKITLLNIIFYKVRSMDAEKGLFVHIMDDGMSSNMDVLFDDQRTTIQSVFLATWM
jgi:hypothetical protein